MILEDDSVTVTREKAVEDDGKYSVESTEYEISFGEGEATISSEGREETYEMSSEETTEELIYAFESDTRNQNQEKGNAEDWHVPELD